jgi:hypothetical protein
VSIYYNQPNLIIPELDNDPAILKVNYLKKRIFLNTSLGNS